MLGLARSDQQPGLRSQKSDKDSRARGESKEPSVCAVKVTKEKS